MLQGSLVLIFVLNIKHQKYKIMKKRNLITGMIIMVLLSSSCQKELLDDPYMEPALKSGHNASEKGNTFDEYGFNWKAHHFRGYLVNAVLGDYLYVDMPFYKWKPYEGEGDSYIQEFINTFGFFMLHPALLDCQLVMHWNEALISREGVYPDTWIDSNGWITFHFSMDKGDQKWSQFQKLVTIRSTDYLENGIWYDKNGKEIGMMSYDWNTLIIVKVVNTGNIPAFMYPEYNSALASGLGKYKIKH
jgi:hypothetical protein